MIELGLWSAKNAITKFTKMTIKRVLTIHKTLIISKHDYEKQQQQQTDKQNYACLQQGSRLLP
jgi:hypothetical protein